jgi:hypothetical protein
MPQTDSRYANLQRRNGTGGRGARFSGCDSRHARRSGPRHRQRDPQKFVPAPRGRNLPGSGGQRFRCVAQGLRAHDARARLTLHRCNANFKRPRRTVPLHAPHRRSPIGARRRNLGSATRAEHSPRTLRWQTETHRRTLHRTPGFVRHQHRHPTGSARANRVRRAITLGHSYRQNGRSIRPPSQGRRQDSRQHSGRFQDHVNGVRRAPTFSPLPFRSRGGRCNPPNSRPAQNA